MSNLSNYQIIWKGYFWVNIPVTIIMFLSFFLFLTLTNLNITICILLSGAVGWIYWSLTISKWIRWALEKNVDPKRLHKLGVSSLLLWPSDIKKIEKIKKEITSNNA